MANRVTQEDIININELYIKYKTYAEVARQTGFSPSTVKKYVIKDYISQSQIKKIEFIQEMIPTEVNFEIFKNKDDWGSLCVLSQEEKEKIEELWMELSL